MTDARGARPGRRSWIPKKLAGRYVIERELGAGAAAVTVAAFDERLGRRVAVKILKPDQQHDAGFARRFTREAQAAASINHPNVVSVYDVGTEGDTYYLVMQLVEGSDVKALIARERAIPWRRAVAIARDLLAGLEAIHAAGIVHRDIKPQNALIGDDGSVLVTDFGVAHVTRDSSLTAAGTTVGTADYMAPEQAQGMAPTPAADVYAVGVLLYEMVTGRLPFHESTAMATMLAHIQQQVPVPAAPGGLEPLPQGVVLAIQQAMAKDPNARFRSAGAMRNALDHPERVVLPVSSGGATRAAPVAAPRHRPAPVQRPAQTSPAPRGRGFAGPFVIALVVLALALGAVAGGYWLLEQRPGFRGGGGEVSAPTAAPATVPVVIAPVATETPPASQPSPTPSPEPPSTSTPSLPPTQPIIEPVDPTNPAVDPSTGGGDEQIIEPIEGSTVVLEPSG